MNHKEMKTKFWTVLLAFAALSIAGCSKEPALDAPDSETGYSPDAVSYIAFGIKRAEDFGTSRADDYIEGDHTFNKGDEQEFALAGDPDAHRVFFFTEEGAYYSSGRLEETAYTSEHDHGTGYKDTERILSTMVIKQSGTDPKPRWILTVINARPWRLQRLTETLQATAGDPGALAKALQWITLDASQYAEETDSTTAAIYTYNGKNYFTMTSAVYLDGDADTGSIVAAAPITDADFHPTITKAVEAPVTVFVERVVAKFTVGFQTVEGGDVVYLSDSETPLVLEPTVIPSEEGNGVDDGKIQLYEEYIKNGDGSFQPPHKRSWKAHIVGWTLNAIEPNSFLFKNVVAGNMTESPTAAKPWQIQTAFYNNWNATSLHRSYWAIDQHYTRDLDFGGSHSGHHYPTQFRPSLDLGATANDGDGSMVSLETVTPSNIYSGRDIMADVDWSLGYMAYNDVLNREDNLYSNENTFGYEDMLKNHGNITAGTHVVIAAQLLIDGLDDGYKESYSAADFSTAADSKGLINGVEDKYFANSSFWNRESYLKYAYDCLQNSLADKYEAADPRDVFVPADNAEDAEYLNIQAHDGKLYIGKTWADSKYLPDLDEGDQYLSHINDYIELKPAYIDGGDGWVTIGLKDGYKAWVLDENGDGRELSQNEIVSLIYRYSGKAKAFTGGRMYYAIPIKHNMQSETFTANPNPHVGYYTSYVAGDYGVVRNHWYRLTVTGIEKIGNPVHDPVIKLFPGPDPDANMMLGVEVEILKWHLWETDVYL